MIALNFWKISCQIKYCCFAALVADASIGGNVMRMLSSWTVNIGTTFFLEAFAMKYGKIMPHCMAKELPVCSNVTSVVDFSVLA